ncbi:MAG: hypothetical protein AAB671_01390 [Patescibacteria group bacterium]
MHDALNKVMSLIQKTGDRCVVVSPETDEAYVVMSLAEYERQTIGKADVSALSEDELLDKINRDIAVWKSQQASGRDDELLLDLRKKDMEPGFGQKGDYFADVSQNFDEFSDVENELEEQEEPFYFERV